MDNESARQLPPAAMRTGKLAAITDDMVARAMLICGGRIEGSIRAILADYDAHRPAPVGYTLEQVEKAAKLVLWDRDDLVGCIINALAPKPKTPEERVTVEAGMGSCFPVYKIDGKILSNEQVTAALVAALKEGQR